MMEKFTQVKYYSDKKIAEYVTASGRRLLRRGGSLCWRLNNAGNLVSPLNEKGIPAPKKTKNYIGFVKAGEKNHYFFVFPDYETGREQLKASLQRKSTLSLAKFIEKYAPPSENNTEKYIADVVKMTGIRKETILDTLSDAEVDSLMDAIEKKEGYHKDADTREEVWAETTTIFTTNGSAPVANMPLKVETNGKENIIKADESGKFPPIPHPKSGSTTIHVPSVDGIWKEALKIEVGAMSQIFQLVVDMFTVKASMQSHEAPPEAKSKRSPIQYRVQPHDNLTKIAKKYRTTVEDLKKNNHLNNDVIHPEQVLWIYEQGADVGVKTPRPVAPVVPKEKTAAQQSKQSPKNSDAATPKQQKLAIEKSAQNITPRKKNTADVVRSKEGEGAPLAVVEVGSTRAPWMIVAIEEARRNAGRSEDGADIEFKKKENGKVSKVKINATGVVETNYHKEIKDGRKSLAGEDNAWCAAFVNYCLMKSYPPYPIDKNDWGGRAHAFLQHSTEAFNKSLPTNPLFEKIEEPIYGAIAVLHNESASRGKHAAFVYSVQDNGKIVLLGGNQNQQINFTPYDKKSLWFFIPSSYRFHLNDRKDAVFLQKNNSSDLNKAFGIPDASDPSSTR
jgi:uncharacterized protein (TIGR02594 family)